MEKVYWLPSDNKEDEAFNETTWFRAVDLNKFLRKVEENNTIEGIIMDTEENNIGFILGKKK